MKFLILGAGPTGLTIGNRLQQLGITDFLILEKEIEPGGLCRSLYVDGAPFDIGGGHFLDTKRPDVNRFLFSFMPKDEWNIFTRNSKIYFKKKYIGHPFESNIWQLNIDDQINYIKAIANAGCNSFNMIPPQKFVEWVYWKFGERIAEDYMLPYNRKVFGDGLNCLGTYWLEKLPDVSLDETIRSCLEKKVYGKEPGHSQFYYPLKYGYGELWKRMALKIKKNIFYKQTVELMDFNNHVVKTADNMTYSAEIIISTIPWTSIKAYVGMPDEICSMIKKLKYSSVETRYFDENISTNAHWIYYPDERIPFHRILVRKNFCPGSKGYWTETNTKRIRLFADSEEKRFKYVNEYAYPLNTLDKPSVMKELLGWTKKHRVFGIGRWGEWQHYNSDVAVGNALEFVKRFKL